MLRNTQSQNSAGYSGNLSGQAKKRTGIYQTASQPSIDTQAPRPQIWRGRRRGQDELVPKKLDAPTVPGTVNVAGTQTQIPMQSSGKSGGFNKGPAPVVSPLSIGINSGKDRARHNAWVEAQKSGKTPVPVSYNPYARGAGPNVDNIDPKTGQPIPEGGYDRFSPPPGWPAGKPAPYIVDGKPSYFPPGVGGEISRKYAPGTAENPIRYVMEGSSQRSSGPATSLINPGVVAPLVAPVAPWKPGSFADIWTQGGYGNLRQRPPGQPMVLRDAFSILAKGGYGRFAL